MPPACPPGSIWRWRPTTAGRSNRPAGHEPARSWPIRRWPRFGASSAARHPRHRSGQAIQLPVERPDRPHLTAALRSAPQKDPADPHRGTKADLDTGTEVLVVNRKSGWLKVHLADGRAGWVSQELVEYVSPSAIDVGEIIVSVHVPTIAEAFILLKRAEMAKMADPTYTPPADDADSLDLAISVLQKTGKYTVDRATYRVSFTPTGKKFTIDTIEDFILFVETVERTYPSATPGEVASEIRQLWFGPPDPN
jgi:hypothetical protein